MHNVRVHTHSVKNLHRHTYTNSTTHYLCACLSHTHSPPPQHTHTHTQLRRVCHRGSIKSPFRLTDQQQSIGSHNIRRGFSGVHAHTQYVTKVHIDYGHNSEIHSPVRRTIHSSDVISWHVIVHGLCNALKLPVSIIGHSSHQEDWTDVVSVESREGTEIYKMALTIKYFLAPSLYMVTM